MMPTVSAFATQSQTVRPYANAEEPQLDEMYTDPVLQAVLKRDGVDLSALKAVVRDARERLAA